VAAVEKLVTGEFARILEAERDRFNARFAYAKRLNRHLEAADFLDHLAHVVAPIVENCAKQAGESLHEIVVALYDLSLELFAQGCLGRNSRYPVVGKAWTLLLREISNMIVAAPRQLVTSISNALINLTAEKSAHENRWLEMMKAISVLCNDEKTFLKAGIVAAWRFGVAHYREGALSSCENIPVPILARIFGLKGRVKMSDTLSVLQRIQEDRWYDPAKESDQKKTGLAVVRRPGGFKGFGGPFVSPPEVMVSEGRFFLSDAEQYWILHADVFGATMRRGGKGKPAGDASSSQSFRIDKAGKVTRGREVYHFKALANASSWASTEDTLVVCLPFSHYVYLIARRKGGVDV